MSTMPICVDWKNPVDVERWKKNFFQRFKQDQARGKKPPGVITAPLLQGVAISGVRIDPVLRARQLEEMSRAGELVQWEDESLSDRLRRVEEHRPKTKKVSISQMKHSPPRMLVRSGENWMLHPRLKHAEDFAVDKAKSMYDSGLVAKAQRQVACGILGGEIECENGHKFYAAYGCECRYCPDCGPRMAKKLFREARLRLTPVAQNLLKCGDPECAECIDAIKNDRLPHWPPPPGTKQPRMVCAKLDFTVRHTGEVPTPETFKSLNRCIKAFMRTLERKFHIKGKYGLAYCDELGKNNSNPHAHGCYVGPWLPNLKNELGAIWEQTTREKFPGTNRIRIEYADRGFGEALWHAVKYPAKFADRTKSSPQRLAQLEVIMHTVHRFHTMVLFYNPPTPKPEPVIQKCPVCDGRLSDWYVFQVVDEMKLRGLRNVRDVEQERKDLQANSPP